MSNAVFIGTVVDLCGEQIPDATVRVTRDKIAIMFEISVIRPSGEPRPVHRDAMSVIGRSASIQYAAGYAQGLLELAVTNQSPESLGKYVAERLVRDLQQATAAASAAPAPPSRG